MITLFESYKNKLEIGDFAYWKTTKSYYGIVILRESETFDDDESSVIFGGSYDDFNDKNGDINIQYINTTSLIEQKHHIIISPEGMIQNHTDAFIQIYNSLVDKLNGGNLNKLVEHFKNEIRHMKHIWEEKIPNMEIYTQVNKYNL